MLANTYMTLNKLRYGSYYFKQPEKGDLLRIFSSVKHFSSYTEEVASHF